MNRAPSKELSVNDKYGAVGKMNDKKTMIWWKNIVDRGLLE